jgi:alanyl-tRNA synthetase
MTIRLDHDDPLLLDFEGEVIAHGRIGDREAVVLDRSAFYPESGGQMADRGTLSPIDGTGGTRVEDVQLDPAGVLHHAIAGALPAIGSRVRGAIDAVRRRTHMALHTGQHLLSRALSEVAGAETVSSRLGESVCTVDVDRDGIAEARIAEAESIVNAIVDEDRAVRAWFPTAEELATLPLRRAPKEGYARIRVVDAGGFDCSPCGGTHVVRTAQIGVLRVIGSERYKGGTRVSFSAGPRARRELATESAALRELARDLGCAPGEARAAIARLCEQLETSRGELGRARAIVARAMTATAIEHDGIVRAAVEEGGLDVIRQVAAELTREGDRIAIVWGPVEGGTHVIVARGPLATRDVRPLFAALADLCGGRGRGRPERAEGRLPSGAPVTTALERALATL